MEQVWEQYKRKDRGLQPNMVIFVLQAMVLNTIYSRR